MMMDLTLWHWFGLAALLAIMDVVLGASFFLVWLGVSAFTVGVLLWLVPQLAWEYQLLIFTIQSLASIAFWRVYLKKHPTTTDKPRLNRRSEQYVGRVFTLEEPIVNGRGKITVDDSSWRVEGADLKAGTRIEVTGVDGVILKVSAVEKST